MKGDVAIQCTDLRKTYRSFKAVKQLNLTVKRGELFGFLGPNGAGKTTSIKMMTGLLEPTEGKVEIAGIDVWASPIEAKAKLAYVPDEPNLYPKLSAWEYLRFIGSVFRMPEERFQKSAEELLALFDISDRADELIESFSHGMRQKVALCGALIHEPDVLFLDEPTVGLDPRSARSLKAVLKKLCERGMTVFLTTHILEIAETMCDRVGIIVDGDVIALGTMEELRAQAKNEQASLEDIFLELTGGDESSELIRFLEDEGEGRR